MYNVLNLDRSMLRHMWHPPSSLLYALSRRFHTYWPSSRVVARRLVRSSLTKKHRNVLRSGEGTLLSISIKFFFRVYKILSSVSIIIVLSKLGFSLFLGW